MEYVAVYLLGFCLFGAFIDLLLSKGKAENLSEYKELIPNTCIKYCVVLFFAFSWVVTFPLFVINLIRER